MSASISPKQAIKNALQALKANDAQKALKCVKKLLKNIDDVYDVKSKYQLYLISGAALSLLKKYSQADKAYCMAIRLEDVEDKTQVWKGYLKLSNVYTDTSMSRCAILRALYESVPGMLYGEMLAECLMSDGVYDEAAEIYEELDDNGNLLLCWTRMDENEFVVEYEKRRGKHVDKYMREVGEATRPVPPEEVARHVDWLERRLKYKLRESMLKRRADMYSRVFPDDTLPQSLQELYLQYLLHTSDDSAKIVCVAESLASVSELAAMVLTVLRTEGDTCAYHQYPWNPVISAPFIVHRAPPPRLIDSWTVWDMWPYIRSLRRRNTPAACEEILRLVEQREKERFEEQPPMDTEDLVDHCRLTIAESHLIRPRSHKQLADAHDVFVQLEERHPVRCWRGLSQCVLKGYPPSDKKTEIAASYAHKILNVSSNDDNAHSYLAYLAMLDSNFDSALEHVQHALTLSPTSAVHHYRLGRIHWAMKDAQVAYKCFLKAAKLDPKMAEAFTYIGHCIKNVRCYEKALQLDPQQEEAGIALSSLYLERGQQLLALQVYDQAIATDSLCSWALHRKGHLCEQRGDLDGALQCYQNALRGDPNSAKIWAALAYVYHKKGKFVPALRSYDRSLSFSDEAPVVCFLRARTLRALGRDNEAIVALRALERFFMVPAVTELARALCDQGEQLWRQGAVVTAVQMLQEGMYLMSRCLDECVTSVTLKVYADICAVLAEISQDWKGVRVAYARCVHEDPQCAGLWSDLCVALCRENRREQAERCGMIAVALDDRHWHVLGAVAGSLHVKHHCFSERNSAESWANLALLYDPDAWQANYSLERARTLNPDMSAVWAAQGLWYESHHSLESIVLSKDAFEESCHLQGNLTARWGLARTCVALKRWHEGEFHLRLLLKVWPHNQQARRLYAVVCEHQKRYCDALEYCDKHSAQCLRLNAKLGRNEEVLRMWREDFDCDSESDNVSLLYHVGLCEWRTLLQRNQEVPLVWKKCLQRANCSQVVAENICSALVHHAHNMQYIERALEKWPLSRRLSELMLSVHIRSGDWNGANDVANGDAHIQKRYADFRGNEVDIVRANTRLYHQDPVRFAKYAPCGPPRDCVERGNDTICLFTQRSAPRVWDVSEDFVTPLSKLHQSPQDSHKWFLYCMRLYSEALRSSSSSRRLTRLALVQRLLLSRKFDDLVDKVLAECVLLDCRAFCCQYNDVDELYAKVRDQVSSEDGHKRLLACVERQWARVRYMRGDTNEQVLTTYQSALEKWPSQVCWWEELSQVLLSWNAISAALECLEGALQHVSSANARARLYLRMAHISYFAKRFKTGLDAIVEAVKLRPQWAVTKLVHGMFLRKLRKLQQAEEVLQSAVVVTETETQLPLVKFNLAMVCLKQKRANEAQALLRSEADYEANYAVSAALCYQVAANTNDKRLQRRYAARALHWNPECAEYRRLVDTFTSRVHN